MDYSQIVLHLLDDISAIKSKYEEFAKITGENFNIFSILHLETDEVRLHSRLIGELLNPKGTHNQNGLFLKLFLEEIGFGKDYTEEANKAEVIVEENIGNITDNYEEGGRIDLVIKFQSKPEIVIENKIWAEDQPNQLGRYYQKYKNAHFVYLTPTEKKPSEDSLRGFPKEKDIKCITYYSHIKNWIEACIKESWDIPVIRETLKQYLNTINQMTEQSTNNKMEEDIKALITKNPEYYKTAIEFSRTVQQIEERLIVSIWEQLFKSFFQKYGSEFIIKGNGVHFFTYKNYNFTIKLNDEFHKVGIWLSPFKQNVFHVANDSEIEELKQYFNSLKSIYGVGNVHENENYTCWVYCKNDFLNFNEERRINLYNKGYIEKLIEDILKEVDLFITTFMDAVTSNPELNADFEFKIKCPSKNI